MGKLGDRVRERGRIDGVCLHAVLRGKRGRGRGVGTVSGGGQRGAIGAEKIVRGGVGNVHLVRVGRDRLGDVMMGRGSRID